MFVTALPLRQLVHISNISNFPHVWNEFQYVGMEGINVVFKKTSNHQRFLVPIWKLSPVRQATAGPEVTLSGEVGLKRDGMGNLGEWFVKN